MRVPLLIITASLLLLGACAPALSGDRENPEDGLLSFAGTVTRIPIEGGFYGIIGKDGTRYDPIELPEGFRQDGLPVQVTARRLEGTVGFHMWGTRIEILEIRKW